MNPLQVQFEVILLPRHRPKFVFQVPSEYANAHQTGCKTAKKKLSYFDH